MPSGDSMSGEASATQSEGLRARPTATDRLHGVRRKTKIIATLGPASETPEMIGRLIAAGMDVARLNFSHGEYDAHRAMAAAVRAEGEKAERAIAVLQDIQGPRIRVGMFPGGAVQLEPGTEVTLRKGSDEASAGEVLIDHLDAAVELSPGDRVLIADGHVRLEVTKLVGDDARAMVVEGGELKQQKGVSFPDNTIDLPPLTEKDYRDLEFGAELGVDLVAASFVGSADDIRLVRKAAGGLPVIAKVERSVAWTNVDEIIVESDGAMVARGDLGVELSLERLPLVQKEIIRKCNAAGRLSITATEMLESMTSSPRPTRAEVTDVANAVLDGTDAVMLSAETAIGDYPVRAIQVMDSICREVEENRRGGSSGAAFLEREQPFPSAVAKSCVEASDNLGLPVIVAFTESGATARLISKYRPRAEIVAFTAVPETYRRMALFWGVTPLAFDRLDSTDEMFARAEAELLSRNLASEGEAVAMVAGIPPNQRASTNLLKLHVLGTDGGGVPGGPGPR